MQCCLSVDRVARHDNGYGLYKPNYVNVRQTTRHHTICIESADSVIIMFYRESKNKIKYIFKTTDLFYSLLNLLQSLIHLVEILCCPQEIVEDDWMWRRLVTCPFGVRVGPPSVAGDGAKQVNKAASSSGLSTEWIHGSAVCHTHKASQRQNHG